jgi:GMP synthase (glutamine-hydrolysing)
VRPIAILQNDESVPPGLLIGSLEARQVPYTLIVVFRDESLPDPGDVGGLVILGGHMGAYEEEDHPFLVAEKELTRLAFGRDLPVLGICLGCQIIADALGGAAYRVEPQEAGLIELDVTAAGEKDPVGGAVEGPMLSWHHDSWDLPPGGTLLAASDKYPQVLRVGSVLGVQYHPEASPEILERWLLRDGASLAEIGLDPAGFLESARVNRRPLRDRADALFGAWIAEAGRLAGRNNR